MTYDPKILEHIRTKLFANLVHYRQRCINELDDAKEVARFIDAELERRK